MTYHSWDHDQWETWGLSLVRERYGHANVVDVPDGAGGDHGLEAFTRDGLAFQCYSAENEPLAPSKRGSLQKKKIGDDVKKFILGGKKLSDVLGDTVIHTWILLTPYHKDASVVSYCNAKAKEVEEAHLDYAATPFHVTVHHLGTYDPEHNALLKRAALTADLTRPPDEVGVAADFEDAWSDLIAVMDGKLAKLPGCDDPVHRAKLRSALLVEQLQGGSLLDRWRNRVPEVATYLQHILDTAKNQLVLDNVGAPGPEDHFQNVRQSIRERIRAGGQLSDINVEHVADMAITDWLQECDLDFVEDLV